MVDLKNKTCGHKGCTKQPSFGVDGSSMKEFCSDHERVGVVNVAHKRCGHKGCTKQLSFGVKDSSTREFLLW